MFHVFGFFAAVRIVCRVCINTNANGSLKTVRQTHIIVVIIGVIFFSTLVCECFVFRARSTTNDGTSAPCTLFEGVIHTLL